MNPSQPSSTIFDQPRPSSTAGKRAQLALLALAETLAMGPWFAASAVLPQLRTEWALTQSQSAWLTMTVQLGFVLGAFGSAVINLPDRVSIPRLFAWSALLAAAANGAIPLLDAGPELAMVLRFLTGVALAGVYPPAMKLVATWCREDRGLGIGLLIGALTLGSAFPHLLNALPFLGESGMPPWRPVLLVTSGMTAVAGLIAFGFIRPGPYLAGTAPFDWKFVGRALTYRPTRLVNLGYLGHMWELYAMWTWAPVFLLESYQRSGLSPAAGRLAGFAVVAVGAVSCFAAGAVADRVGRTTISAWSMAVSGTCALLAGLLAGAPVALTVLCLIWGISVVSDSAQFSAAASELTDPRYVGTTLAVQTSMGFLLTLVTIRLVPVLVDRFGWVAGFALLAPGPLAGVGAMLRLRRLPEAVKMASGNR
jgi:MFS family permease